MKRDEVVTINHDQYFSQEEWTLGEKNYFDIPKDLRVWVRKKAVHEYIATKPHWYQK